MQTTADRGQIRQFLNLDLVEHPPDYEILESLPKAGFTRQRILYTAVDGDKIPAFLLIPEGQGLFPAVLIHHQHHGQRHLGKSEVLGLAGDPLQAFAPQLARRGFVVLAPDSVCFEDRRKHASGIEPHKGDDIQHFIEMGNRLSLGDTLMRKVLADASSGLCLLGSLPQVDAKRIGVLGHSYGGNTVLFQSALEPRIAYAISSGALCSYAYKRAHDIALEFALIIPGFADRWDLHDLLDCIAPRPLFILSAADDPASKDAPEVIGRARANDNIKHFHDRGGHSMTAERFQAIITFLTGCAGSQSLS